MSDRRIVVQHADMRRLTILESEFDNPDANPLNREHNTVLWDSDRNESVTTTYPAKPVDDWVSLRQAGFLPYSYIHPKACDDFCEHETTEPVHEGHEIRLPEGYTV